MSNIIYFKPKEDLACEENLKRFIAHCRDSLTLYNDQGGWGVNRWYNVSSKGKRIPIPFAKYKIDSHVTSVPMDPLDEPFLSFTKAYIRYDQSIKAVLNLGSRLCALRTLHDALIEIHGIADIIKTDSAVIVKCAELIPQRCKSKDLQHKAGLSLKNLFDFIREKKFVLNLQDWTPPWQKAISKANRTDAESRKWQEERCPSQHQMITIADCFANAQTPEDKYWSSVLVFLMFAPGRVSELADLTIDCLHRGENGALGVRWYGAKGFGDHIKWVPKPLEEAVIEAHKRLVEAGKPARAAAKYAYENPGLFLRHAECVTPDDFPEDKPLTAYEFAKAMNFPGSVVNKKANYLASEPDGRSYWNNLAHTASWVKSECVNGDWTYRDLANFTLKTYRDLRWPLMPSLDRPIWDSLTLSRKREFFSRNNVRTFSWVQLSDKELNLQISINNKVVYEKISTMFQRMGYKDEDGSDISLTSHQLRVWLSTNAERQGMDAWKLAQWAGRSRVNDNYHYDLRTPEEREDNHRAILALKKRPTALEALKLNLPVSYQDLGLSRLGIADVTEYGMCVHDYSMSPCLKGGECMICREHVCIKGMPKTLNNIKRLEKLVESQFDKAKEATENGTFGADRWVTYLGWKLAHIRTQRARMESEDTPEGAVLWIPPEHDPSPVMRALNHQNLETSASADTPNDKDLLGIEDA